MGPLLSLSGRFLHHSVRAPHHGHSRTCPVPDTPITWSKPRFAALSGTSRPLRRWHACGYELFAMRDSNAHRWTHPETILVATDLSDVDRLMPFALEEAVDKRLRATVTTLRDWTAGPPYSAAFPFRFCASNRFVPNRALVIHGFLLHLRVPPHLSTRKGGSDLA
jgi:hypothetical protein